jgi:predicted thioredoxin/glutaredoxin
MNPRPRTVEVFSAGCALCEETIAMVRRLASGSCEVRVLDMRLPDVAARAREHGIRSVPAVVIDGKLAECCADRGVDETVLLRAGLGETRQT